MSSVLNTTLMLREVDLDKDKYQYDLEQAFFDNISCTDIILNCEKLKSKQVGHYSEKGTVKLYKVVKNEYLHLYDIDHECGYFYMKYDDNTINSEYEIEDLSHLMYVVLEYVTGTCVYCGGVETLEDIPIVIDTIVSKAYISDSLDEASKYYDSRTLIEM